MKTKNPRPKPGRGWRLLTKREKYMGCKLHRLPTLDIVCWSEVVLRWLPSSAGFSGVCPHLHYRTRKPKNYFLTH